MGTGAEALGSGLTGEVGALPLPVVGGELLPPVTVPFCCSSPACSKLWASQSQRINGLNLGKGFCGVRTAAP